MSAREKYFFHFLRKTFGEVEYLYYFCVRKSKVCVLQEVAQADFQHYDMMDLADNDSM